MSAIAFWLASVMTGAGFGTHNLFGQVFMWAGVLLLLTSLAFEWIEED